ncbi:MAG: threonine ammonia-lyase [Vicinamibacterales bacterium]
MILIDDIRGAAARIAPHILRPPVRRSEWLSRARGAVLFKVETVQPTSSYKIRGAFNAVLRLREASRDGAAVSRLVTASAGNHGRALAFAAQTLGFPLTVFIAANAPAAKIDPIRAAGADVRACRDYDEAEREAKLFAKASGGVFISPYSHPDVIAGAGTIGLELVDDIPELAAVVVPVGGGGLISGIGLAVKALSPSTRVVGVEVAASCPFTKSLAAGRLVTIDVQPSLADGLTGNLDPDTITFDIVRTVVDEVVVVDETDLRRALAGMVAREHLLLEGAAAAGPAALVSGKVNASGTIAVVLTGANIDPAKLMDVLKQA